MKCIGPTNILQITPKNHFPVAKNLSKIPEELHASSIRILYQNLKYLLLTPSILEKTESKKKRKEISPSRDPQTNVFSTEISSI
ncbi:MAG: hypothetical protein VXY56_04520, partial [Pseudomonadota bacterium]|nr:hypothetical protein [Pseudomonadota bacterium]